MAKKFLLIAAALVLGAAMVSAETLNVNITIRQPLVSSNPVALDFGTVDAGSGLQTITAAAGVQLNGGNAGSFDFTGEGTALVDVTLPATVSVTGPGPAMSVTIVGPASFNLVAGAATYYIGGTVTPAAAGVQTSGAYTGSGTVTFVYN